LHPARYYQTDPTGSTTAPPASAGRRRRGGRPRRGPGTRPFGATSAVTRQDTTDVDTPQSVQLDFQTGVAPDTLVFGYVRWVDWSDFEVRPSLYADTTAALLGQSRALVAYQHDTWTYNLGVGRQITEHFAASLSLTWEPSVGGEMTSLGPYDGRTVGTFAGTYETGPWSLTGGVSYGVLGDTHNVLQTDFNDGKVWAAGLRVGYSF